MLYFSLSDLNSNWVLLLGTLLRLLIPINLSSYKENLQPFATVDFSKILYVDGQSIASQGLGNHVITQARIEI
jgi:hypothetical protein